MGNIVKRNRSINGQPVVGMDVHKDSISACVRDTESNLILAERRFAALRP